MTSSGASSRPAEPGQLGVFARSQYEDVLIVRVHALVSEDVWSKRYAQINQLERRLSRAAPRSSR